VDDRLPDEPLGEIKIDRDTRNMTIESFGDIRATTQDGFMKLGRKTESYEVTLELSSSDEVDFCQWDVGKDGTKIKTVKKLNMGSFHNRLNIPEPTVEDFDGVEWQSLSESGEVSDLIEFSSKHPAEGETVTTIKANSDALDMNVNNSGMRLERTTNPETTALRISDEQHELFSIEARRNYLLDMVTRSDIDMRFSVWEHIALCTSHAELDHWEWEFMTYVMHPDAESGKGDSGEYVTYLRLYMVNNISFMASQFPIRFDTPELQISMNNGGNLYTTTWNNGNSSIDFSWVTTSTSQNIPINQIKFETGGAITYNINADLKCKSLNLQTSSHDHLDSFAYETGWDNWSANQLVDASEIKKAITEHGGGGGGGTTYWDKGSDGLPELQYTVERDGGIQNVIVANPVLNKPNLDCLYIIHFMNPDLRDVLFINLDTGIGYKEKIEIPTNEDGLIGQLDMDYNGKMYDTIPYRINYTSVGKNICVFLNYPNELDVVVVYNPSFPMGEDYITPTSDIEYVRVNDVRAYASSAMGAVQTRILNNHALTDDDQLVTWGEVKSMFQKLCIANGLQMPEEEW
jgi:hypothetical protein